MDRKKDRPPRTTGREDLFFTGLKKRPASTLNGPVWRLLLLVAAACALAWVSNRLLPAKAGIFRSGLSTLVALAGWALAVRLLFIETRARVFWIVWLVVGLLPLSVSIGARYSWISASVFSFIFLLFRRYRPYRHLTSRRQTALFGVGLVMFVVLTIFWNVPPTSSGLGLTVLGQAPGAAPSLETPAALRNVLSYSVVSLRWFWFFSLFNLFFAIRLHFMKLRPKLAVAALFLVVVPIVLLITLGLGMLYTTLGESHAARARAILDDWADLAARDPSFIRIISPSWFSAAGAVGGMETAGSPPPWVPQFMAALGAASSPWTAEASSAGAYFLQGKAVWLVGLSRSEDRVVLRGCPVDSALLDRLARILRSDIILGSTNPATLAVLMPALDGRSPSEEERVRLKEQGFEVKGTYSLPRPPAKEGASARTGSPSPRQRPIFFGVTQLDILTLEGGKFSKASLVLQTPRSLATTWDELFSASNPLGSLAMASLIVLGFVFVVLETLALIFGLRVSGGITKGIKALHRHLCCVSEGDLEAQIEIPNEDELGDLAASFNQMTAAIKQGREEAIARERLEKELETAHQIQERLLPHTMPTMPGFDVSGTSLPSHEVGGDYFDFLDLDSGHLGVAIADVAGKGIPAALLMANLQASLRAQSLDPEKVSVVAARLNALLVKNTDERMFVTFFYGILDRMKATLTYTNAGHNPPLLLHPDGRLDRLTEGGLLLGFLADQAYLQGTAILESGDVLLLFTDGITEAVNPQAENRETKYFGEERLIEILRANAGRSVVDIQAAVLAAVTEHTRRSPQSDDITLVVIKRTGERELPAYVS